MKKVAIIISPNYKDYGRKYLDDCIKSIRAQDYLGEIKIFITDNESSQESFEFLKSKLPEAEIHRNKRNDGFAKGCNDSIKLALAKGFDYIFLISIHSALEKNCIKKLAETVESDSKIGVAQARMMLWGEDNRISSLGNDTHFLGFGYCRSYRDKWEKQIKEVGDIFYASGASMFFKRQALEEAGLFDEEYWMYNEDQELSWRLRLLGWRTVVAPEAVAWTKYEFQRSIKKFYWMDRNRIISILKCYHWATLVLIFPAFVIMELGLILFSLKTGWFKEKIRIWIYFLKLSTWKYLLKTRYQIQRSRKIKERKIKGLISGRIWYQEVDDWKLRIINPVFNFYWQAVKKIIFW